MPQVSFDANSLLIGGRRTTIVGAALEYALLPVSQWASSLALLRQSGFNTVRTSSPWSLHEQIKGKARFDGALSLRSFVEACRTQRLWVILRIGPAVGGTFGGGGLPAWLSEIEGLRPREPNDVFLRLVSRWYGAVLSEIKGLETTARGDERSGSDSPGGILAVQIDHGWECGNAKAGGVYLRELRRFVREGGIELPILTANGLWLTAEEVIDIWEGSENLFSHVRQLRRVQPDGPAIVEIRHPSALRYRSPIVEPATRSRGVGARSVLESASLPTLVARVVAAGGQAIVAHAAPEIHRTLPAGTDAHGPLASAAVEPQLIDAAGKGTATLRSLSALALFLSHFGTALGDGGSTDSVVVDPDHPISDPPIVVSRGSTAGTVAFVFRNEMAGQERPVVEARQVTLITPDGMRLPVALGNESVAWFAIGLDLHGKARLDYSGLSPIAFIDRQALILFGPAGVRAPISIAGSELTVTVPGADAGARPRVVKHAGLTLVVCNEAQASAILVHGRGVTIGADSIAADGSVTLAPEWREAVRVEANGQVKSIPGANPDRRRGTSSTRARDKKLGGGLQSGAWSRSEASAFVSGESPRYASIASPRSLASFAVKSGFGWYRLRLPRKSGEQLLWLPGASGGLRGFIDGEEVTRTGKARPFPFRIPGGRGAGVQTVVFLSHDDGRSVAGLEQNLAPGISGDGWIVRPQKSAIKVIQPPPFDPFERRALIPGLPGAAPERALAFGVSPLRGNPIIIDPGQAFFGAVLLNGALVDVVERRDEAMRGITISRECPGWDKGRASITLIPLRAAPELEHTLRVFRCEHPIEAAVRGQSAWAFARWEVPPPESPDWDAAKAPGRRDSAIRKGSNGGGPAWWRMRATGHGALELNLEGMTSGLVLIDGAIVGRYESEQDRVLTLPPDALAKGGEIVIFDEGGADPKRVHLSAANSSRKIKSRRDARSS